MMEEIEAERDMYKDRCVQLENQLEISQKIVDTQQASLDAKEVCKPTKLSITIAFHEYRIKTLLYGRYLNIAWRTRKKT